jgi:hypothetical protein
MPLMSREFFEWAVDLEEGVNVSAGFDPDATPPSLRHEDDPTIATGGFKVNPRVPSGKKRPGTKSVSRAQVQPALSEK